MIPQDEANTKERVRVASKLVLHLALERKTRTNGETVVKRQFFDRFIFTAGYWSNLAEQSSLVLFRHCVTPCPPQSVHFTGNICQPFEGMPRDLRYFDGRNSQLNNQWSDIIPLESVIATFTSKSERAFSGLYTNHSTSERDEIL